MKRRGSLMRMVIVAATAALPVLFLGVFLEMSNEILKRAVLLTIGVVVARHIIRAAFADWNQV